MKKTEYSSKEPKTLPVDFIAPFSIKACRKRLFDFAKRTEVKTNNWWNREYFDFHITQEKQNISFQLTRHLNSIISVNATGYLVPKSEDNTHIIARLHFGLDTYLSMAFIAFTAIILLFSTSILLEELAIIFVIYAYVGWRIYNARKTLKFTLENTLGFYIEEDNKPIRELVEFE